KTGKKPPGGLVLDKNGGIGAQHPPPKPPIPAEERLIRSEDGARQERGDPALAELGQVVVPELVFDKNGEPRTDRFDEAAGVPGAVHGEVKNMIREGIPAADFQAGRGEEGQHQTDPGLLPAEAFDEGTTLLEFAQGGAMEPDDGAVFRL